MHLVVDGYNVTKTGYGEMSLAEQRTRLIGALAGLAAQTGAEITIVFDGAGQAAVANRRRRAGCGCCSAPPARPPTT